MKKIFAILLLTTLAACDTMGTSGTQPVAKPTTTAAPVEALKNLKLGCTSVKGVKDPEHGRIYYTSKHNLFKYVKMDSGKDRYFCTTSEAEKAGFKAAPEHFSGSVYYFLQDLHAEGNGGKAHDYVGGIYKSLQIYEKVCGGNPSKAELAGVVESYAKREKDAMDSGKYEGVTAALINRYRCRR